MLSAVIGAFPSRLEPAAVTYISLLVTTAHRHRILFVLPRAKDELACLPSPLLLVVGVARWLAAFVE